LHAAREGFSRRKPLTCLSNHDILLSFANLILDMNRLLFLLLSRAGHPLGTVSLSLDTAQDFSVELQSDMFFRYLWM